MTFWRFLIKKIIPLNEEQFKSIEGNNLRYLHWKNICLYFHMKKNNHRTKIQNGNFSIQKYSGYIINFLTLSSGILRVLCNSKFRRFYSLLKWLNSSLLSIYCANKWWKQTLGIEFSLCKLSQNVFLTNYKREECTTWRL